MLGQQFQSEDISIKHNVLCLKKHISKDSETNAAIRLVTSVTAAATYFLEV
jgi:hypothetical protein